MFINKQTTYLIKASIYLKHTNIYNQVTKVALIKFNSKSFRFSLFLTLFSLLNETMPITILKKYITLNNHIIWLYACNKIINSQLRAWLLQLFAFHFKGWTLRDEWFTKGSGKLSSVLHSHTEETWMMSKVKTRSNCMDRVRSECGASSWMSVVCVGMKSAKWNQT